MVYCLGGILIHTDAGIPDLARSGSIRVFIFQLSFFFLYKKSFRLESELKSMSISLNETKCTNDRFT